MGNVSNELKEIEFKLEYDQLKNEICQNENDLKALQSQDTETIETLANLLRNRVELNKRIKKLNEHLLNMHLCKSQDEDLYHDLDTSEFESDVDLDVDSKCVFECESSCAYYDGDHDDDLDSMAISDDLSEKTTERMQNLDNDMSAYLMQGNDLESKVRPGVRFSPESIDQEFAAQQEKQIKPILPLYDLYECDESEEEIPQFSKGTLLVADDGRNSLTIVDEKERLRETALESQNEVSKNESEIGKIALMNVATKILDVDSSKDEVCLVPDSCENSCQHPSEFCFQDLTKELNEANDQMTPAMKLRTFSAPPKESFSFKLSISDESCISRRSSDNETLSTTEMDNVDYTWDYPSSSLNVDRDRALQVFDYVVAPPESKEFVRDVAGDFIVPGMNLTRRLSTSVDVNGKLMIWQIIYAVSSVVAVLGLMYAIKNTDLCMHMRHIVYYLFHWNEDWYRKKWAIKDERSFKMGRAVYLEVFRTINRIINKYK